MTGGRGPSTPNSAGPSTPPTYHVGTSSATSTNGTCANCILLANEVSVLKATLEMYMHPENHTDASAALLHQLYDTLEKLRLN